MRVVMEINGIEIADQEGFNRFLLKVGFIIEGAIVEKIRQLGLVKTGRFMGSIHTYLKENSVIIADGVEYGKYLEYGTKAHMIKPKTKKALHWKEGRADRFSRGHMVKGIKVYAPFRRGFVSAIPKLREAFN